MNDSSAKSTGISAQTLSLPKAGGAVSGLNATTAANTFSGTFTASVSLTTTPSRALGPTLSLQYDSSAGNGIFGVGFALPVPVIARKITLHIPRYDQTDDFTASVAGDLTPVGAPVTDADDWTRTTYVPRQANGFPLFTYAINRKTGESYWTEQRGDNTTHVYGRSELARVANPDEPTQIFQWNLEEDRDTKGNRVRYVYDQDKPNAPDELFEINRSVTAQKYLTRIEYGNYFATLDPPLEACAFEVIFDYGERPVSTEDLASQAGIALDPHTPVQDPLPRLDPFSTYRSGFEIRTTRLCRRILMFHHFPELGAEPCLVRDTRLAYDESPTLTRLSSITEVGCRRREDGSYWTSEKPALTFTYSPFEIPTFPTFAPLDVQADGAVPGLLNTGAYQFIDLKSEGLPGVLLSTAETSLYYEPRGDAHYASPQPLPRFPNARNLTDPRFQLRDVNADSLLDFVDTSTNAAGFFQQQTDGSWAPFQPFEAYPTSQEHLEYVDLDGSGRQSLLLVRPSDLLVFPSMGTRGFEPPTSAPRNDGFPSTVDPSQYEIVTFADVFGDGLAHRVDIRDGQVRAWPNLGYGRFGAPISFGNAPRFGPDAVASRIYLADLDGSGPADLIVAYADRLEISLNRSGNTFSEPFVVQLPALLADGAQLTFADVFGRGMTSIVFTTLSPAPRHWACTLGAIDGVTGDVVKPYLLTRTDNGLGAVSHVTYVSSVRSYLEDKAAGRPWVTRLPFPVQVVARVDHVDEISRSLMVSRFRYHDGYYDIAERQFAGFGYVESWDAEQPLEFLKIAQARGLALDSPAFPHAPGAPPASALDGAAAESTYVMPSYVRTWFYTGAFEDEPALNAQYAREYFHGDPEEDRDFPGPVFAPPILEGGTRLIRQAYWSLKGKQRRQELYGEDGGPQSETPYTVTEQNYLVTLAASAEKRYASFLTTDREKLTYTYEREADDPRVTQTYVLERDAYGNERLSCEVFYPRRSAPGRHTEPEQMQVRGTLTQTAFINLVGADVRALGVTYEKRELDTNSLELNGSRYFPFDALAAQVAEALAHEIPYGAPFTADVRQARPFDWEQTYFWNADLTGMLPLGETAPQTLAHHMRTAAFTDDWLAIYGGRVDAALLHDRGGFLKTADGYWWSRTPIAYFLSGAGQFYEPSRLAFDYDEPSLADNLRTDRRVLFDAPYYLVTIEQRESVSEDVETTTVASIDYAVMKPWQLVDDNGVHSQVLYDPLAIVFATSIFKFVDGVRIGDGDLAGYVVRPPAPVPAVLADKPYYLQDATTFLSYDLLAWQRDRRPASWVELQRQEHVSDETSGQPGPIQALVGYFDGFSRVVERKQEADPVEVPPPDARVPEPARVLVRAAAPTDRRWIVSERTVFNNKGKPAETYAPYYSDTPDFDPVLAAFAGALVPPPTRFHYDPLVRLIRIDTPKGFFQQTVRRAWSTAQYDEDDTVIDSPYYIWFIGHYPADPTQEQKDEKAALDKAAVFFNTPSIDVLDNRGYRIRGIANNLGNVPPDAFTAIVQGSGVTSRQLWQDLIDRGYLVPSVHPSGGAWVTQAFQPYAPGFVLQLGPLFQPFAAPVTALLLQNMLTTFYGLDARGWETTLIDPRLYLDVVQRQAEAVSFSYTYPMVLEKKTPGAESSAAQSSSADASAEGASSDKAPEPWRTKSADAGERWIVKNVANAGANIWDARGYAIAFTLDRLQRPCAVDVTNPLGVVVRAEEMTYGDGLPDAARHNLWGQVYEFRDNAGLLVHADYNLEQQVAFSSRQFRVDYKGPVDWAKPVLLHDKRYETRTTYTVQKRVRTTRSDDGSLYAAGYYLSGRVRDVNMTWPDETITACLDAATYTASGKPVTVAYGNLVATRRTYETTTGRLLRIFSERPAPPDVRTLQHVTYTYDPVGNVTLTRDLTADTVFCYNQAVEAKGDYTYDALYRILRATGRQHPGIDASTHINGFKQSIFAALCPPDPRDRVKLENYAETYAYDNSNNLVRLAHTALSASFVRETPVDATSNRLADRPYDESGNSLTLSLNNTVSLIWDYVNRLERTTIIEREEEPNDELFFNYDHAGQRVRKVTNRVTQGGTVTETEDWLYIGAYQVKLRHIESGDEDECATETTVAAQRWRVAAGDMSIANIYLTPAPPQATGRTRTRAGTRTTRAADATRDVRFQLSTLLASIAVEVDESGEIQSYEEYFPFGGTSIIAGPSRAAVIPKVFRYSDKEADDSTGLYYFGARYFAPWQSRWLTPDPAGTVDGLNLYDFVGNNPLTRQDVDGRQWRTPAAWHAASLAAGPIYSHLSQTLADRPGGIPDIRRGAAQGPTSGYYRSDTHEITVDNANWRQNAVSGEWELNEAGWSVAIFEATNALHRGALDSVRGTAKAPSSSSAGDRDSARRSYSEQIEGVEYSGTGLHHNIIAELRANNPFVFGPASAIYSHGAAPMWTDVGTYLGDQRAGGHTTLYDQQYDRMFPAAPRGPNLFQTFLFGILAALLIYALFFRGGSA